MTLKRVAAWIGIGTLGTFLMIPLFGQGRRGHAELKTAGGAVTVDYGQPALKGRDMLSQLTEGSFWRMGMNEATVLTTPVALMFGSTHVDKGSYSLWLEKAAGDKYQLVFNSQTGQWGTQHDPGKDVHKVPLKKEALSNPVEVYLISLKDAPNGGTFQMEWGVTKLSAGFQLMK